MADGRLVYDGAVAIDPRYYPLGTYFRLKLPGRPWRIYRGEDTGPAIKGLGRFDIWMRSCADAINFGVSPIKYQIIAKGFVFKRTNKSRS